jgi:choline kinase
MARPKTALLLLAGRGSRLQEFTQETPKCLVQVNGKTILERMLANLEAYGIAKVIMVVGYQREKIINAVNGKRPNLDIQFVVNSEWDKTNNIVSLYMAKDYLNEDFLLIEGDIVAEQESLFLLDAPNLMALDHFQDFMDGTVVSLTEDNEVARFYLKSSPDRPEDLSGLYKTVNIYSLANQDFRWSILPRLDRLIANNETQTYYERAFAEAVNSGEVLFQGVDYSGLQWAEIDDPKDLHYAEKLFANH